MHIDGDFSSTPSTGESLKHLVPCSCEESKLHKVQGEHKATLDSIWKRATELCQSNSLGKFLRKRGKLSSLHVNQGTSLHAYGNIYFKKLLLLCLPYFCQLQGIDQYQ